MWEGNIVCSMIGGMVLIFIIMKCVCRVCCIGCIRVRGLVIVGRTRLFLDIRKVVVRIV